MSSFSDGIGSAVKSAFCSGLTTSEQLFSNFANVFPPAKVVEYTSEYLAGMVCDIPPSDYVPPSSSPPQFLGGQCPGKPYRVTYDVAVTNLDGTASFGNLSGTFTNVAGIVEGLVISANRKQVICNHAGTATTGLTLTSGSQFLGAFTNVVVVTVDGSPDDCGNLSPPSLPSAPVTIPDVPVDYNDPVGSPVSEDRDVTFYVPYFDIDGDLKVDVKIDDLVGKVNLFDNFKFKPTINIGRRGKDGDPVGDDSPPSSEDTVTEPEEEEYLPIIGVFVKSASNGQETSTTIFQSSAPNVIFPRLANVHFFVRRGGRSGWIPAISCASADAYVVCPDVAGAEDVRVEWSRGWDGTYIPVYAEPSPPT